MSLSIEGRELRSVHFVGILGCGMSALAQFLVWSGIDVTGSDRLLGHEETARDEAVLRDLGCRLFPQDGSGIGADTSAVVVSTAIESSNPDIARAGAISAPVVHRSQLLAAIVKTRTTIAVAGTSGKSTVTAMIFELLSKCGKEPSLITGAGLLHLSSRGHIGNAWVGTSDLLVIEADESDGSLVRYHPRLGLFLNVSTDHKPIPETIELFQTLAGQCRVVVVNGDDPLLTALPADRNFGLSGSAGFRADEIVFTTHNTRIVRNGVVFEVPLPGRHNASNALAALCVCEYLGCPASALAQAIAQFRGIRRRFSVVSRGAVTVIDDYAHNPAKISAALTAARQLGTRIVALFQPHGYGPLRFMKDDLIRAFHETLRPEDLLIMLPVYYAGGTVRRDISAQTVAQELAVNGLTVRAPQSREDVIPLLKTVVSAGDCIISMGARDPSLEQFAQSIAAALDN